MWKEGSDVRVSISIPPIGRPKRPPPPSIDRPTHSTTTITTTDRLRRLGLSSEAETQARAAFPDETGMLVVDQVLPEGPGAGQLEPGDILLGIGADEAELELIATFVPLEEQLDSHVGGRVVLRTQRGGAERVLTLDVQDLHALVPTKLLAISSAILHEVTLHIGKAYNLPAAKAVYLSATGYMFSRAGEYAARHLHLEVL